MVVETRPILVAKVVDQPNGRRLTKLNEEPVWRPGDERLHLSDPMARPSAVRTSSSEALGAPAEDARASGGKE